MITTKRMWAAKPFLVAYMVAVGFTIGLLVNRAPTEQEAVPVMAGVGAAQRVNTAGEHEGKEPPLWLQLFRPSQPTSRMMIRMGLPVLAVVDGSAQELENRNLLVYWTAESEGKPQSLFQVVLPFLRKERPSVVAKPTTPPKTGGSAIAPTERAAQPHPASPSTYTVANGGLPLIGIYHTHDWESYISEFSGLDVKTSKDLDRIVSYDRSKKTVVDLGNALAVRLRDLGVTTVHAPFKHQELGYEFAYKSSRATVHKILREAPTTRILIDLHRDGVMEANTSTMIKGQKVAQIRCIIGQYQQPNWERNKGFCDSLMNRLEQTYPGLTLPTRVQNDTYNQDMMPSAILLEIGNALNRYDEAERAVLLLAEALNALVRAGEYPR